MRILCLCALTHKQPLCRGQETVFSSPSSLGGNVIFGVEVRAVPVVLCLLLGALLAVQLAALALSNV